MKIMLLNSSTKVQAQLEQIEMGVGDRFGQIILMLAEIISGFGVGFITSWKLTLVLLCSFPIMISALIISDYCGENLLIKSRKIRQKHQVYRVFYTSSQKKTLYLHSIIE